MSWITANNNQNINLGTIPIVTIETIREDAIRHIQAGKRIIGFFGCRNNEGVRLFVILADDATSSLLVSSVVFDEGTNAYPSITASVPAFCNYEREFYENFGIEPVDHPWLKPLRYAHDRHNWNNSMSTYPFFHLGGEGVHEVAVGPVHAGVIEPGHFRFMCEGETVHHLEIQLGYQHRGIEALMMVPGGTMRKATLLESVAGDSVIANTTAYAGIAESTAGVAVSKRAMAIRAIALEMERAGIHIGNLGAICADIGYLTGNAFMGATRTYVINSLLAICGSRFGRGLVRPGGVFHDIDEALAGSISQTMAQVLDRVEMMCEKMFNCPSVLSRLQKTGVVDHRTATEIGMTGPTGRASGLKLDVRASHPWGFYRLVPFYRISLETGDVFARSFMRYMEIRRSLEFVIEQLSSLEDGELMMVSESMSPQTLTISLVEGVRGEIMHSCITDKEGEIAHYKIREPSFANWLGLACAVRGEGISDFPLCNKSFDLSYCGHDL